MKKNIVILLLVAVLLAAVYFAVQYLPESQPENTEPENEQIALFTIAKEQIQSILIANQHDTFELVLTDGVWHFKDETDVNVIQPKADGLAYDIATIAARNIAENNAGDLSMYGLDPCVSAVTVTLSDGTQHVLYVGNNTLDGTAYYASVDGNNTVYCISSGKGQMFTASKNDFISLNLTTVSQDQIKSVTLQKNDGTQIVVCQTMQENGLNTWELTEPYHWTGSTSLIQSEILSKVTGLVATAYEMEKSDEEMGLLSPAATVSIEKVDGEVVHYYIGDTTDSGCYIKVDGIKFPALVDPSVALLTEVTPFSVVEKSVEVPDMATLSEVQIDIGEIAIRLQEKDGEWLHNGESVTKEQILNIYTAICALKIDQYAPKQQGGAQVGTMHFAYTDGNVHDYVIGKYDERNYSITKDGSTFFLIRKTEFDAWLNRLS